MSKIHERKQAARWWLAGAVAGGLVLYGAVRLGQRLLTLPRMQRLAQLVSGLFDPGAAGRPAAEAETLFQAEAAAGDEPGWMPHGHRPSLYGPN